MIPTLLVVGLVLGPVLHRRLGLAAVAVVAVSLAWTIVVGIGGDLSPAGALGALLLGAANVLVGLAISGVIAGAATRLSSRFPTLRR